MLKNVQSEKYSETETVRRSEAALKRMLNTPPTHHTPKAKRRAKRKARRVKSQGRAKL